MDFMGCLVTTGGPLTKYRLGMVHSIQMHAHNLNSMCKEARLEGWSDFFQATRSTYYAPKSLEVSILQESSQPWIEKNLLPQKAIKARHSQIVEQRIAQHAELLSSGHDETLTNWKLTPAGVVEPDFPLATLNLITKDRFFSLGGPSLGKCMFHFSYLACKVGMPNVTIDNSDNVFLPRTGQIV